MCFYYFWYTYVHSFSSDVYFLKKAFVLKYFFLESEGFITEDYLKSA